MGAITQVPQEALKTEKSSKWSALADIFCFRRPLFQVFQFMKEYNIFIDAYCVWQLKNHQNVRKWIQSSQLLVISLSKKQTTYRFNHKIEGIIWFMWTRIQFCEFPTQLWLNSFEPTVIHMFTNINFINFSLFYSLRPSIKT